ncbi:MAG: rod shape-determining protein MreC [Spirochaetota bacterium]
MRIRETLSRHRNGLTLVVLVAVCLVSLGVSTESMSLRPKEVGQSFVAVFQQAGAAVGRFFADTVTSIRELSALREQYDELVADLREYETVADDIELLRAENERLREALEFEERLPLENIPSRVIAKEPGSFFSGLTINKGRAAGVERYMPVIANQDGVQGLVGRVEEVGLTTSVVMPVFDRNSYVAARLMRSRHEGLVAGEGAAASAGRLTMLYVAKSARAEISVEDMVITSGMRSIFPEGIRIGTVQSIQGRPYETSLHITLEPMVDFSRLEYVFVLAEGGE